MRCSDLVLGNYAIRLIRMHSKTHQWGKWVISCCWLTCLTGLSSGKNMGLEEESSTDALATSWKIRNWSWEDEKAKTKFWQTSPRSPLKVKRRRPEVLCSPRASYLSASRRWSEERRPCGRQRWRDTEIVDSACRPDSVGRKQTSATGRGPVQRYVRVVCTLPRRVTAHRWPSCSVPRAEVVNSLYHPAEGRQIKNWLACHRGVHSQLGSWEGGVAKHGKCPSCWCSYSDSGI